MNGFDDNFLRYLSANHPTDYIKAKSDDLKPETSSAIFSYYSKDFNIWQKVPETLKHRYGDIIPAEIMQWVEEGNYEAIREVERSDISCTKEKLNNSNNTENDKNTDKSDSEKEFWNAVNEISKDWFLLIHADPFEHLGAERPSDEEILADFAYINAKSKVSEQSAFKIAEDILARRLQDRHFAETHTKPTKEDIKKRIDTRKRDHAIISQEWDEKQPEKYLINQFAKFNKGEISKDEFIPIVSDLMQKIIENNRITQLQEYIDKMGVQNKIAYFRTKNFDVFSQAILSEVNPNSKHNSEIRQTIINTMIRKVIGREQNGKLDNPQEKINRIVHRAKTLGVDIDISTLQKNEKDKKGVLSPELAQMLAVSCIIHGVAFKGNDDTRIDLNSKIIEKLGPQDKEKLISSLITLSRQKMINNQPAINNSENNAQSSKQQTFNNKTILRQMSAIYNNRQASA